MRQQSYEIMWSSLVILRYFCCHRLMEWMKLDLHNFVWIRVASSLYAHRSVIAVFMPRVAKQRGKYTLQLHSSEHRNSYLQQYECYFMYYIIQLTDKWWMRIFSHRIPVSLTLFTFNWWRPNRIHMTLRHVIWDGTVCQMTSYISCGIVTNLRCWLVNIGSGICAIRQHAITLA